MGNTIPDSMYSDAIAAYEKSGRNKSAAARMLGWPERTFGGRLEKALARSKNFDPEIQAAADAGGITDPRNLAHFWKISKDAEGNGYSLFVKNPASGQNVSVLDLMRETIEEAQPPRLPFPKRQHEGGEHLLVIDLADVHFLKLAVRTETGQEYNRDIARHRVIEGTKALLHMARPMGIGRILFVLGNDILHTDGPRSTTTSGTFQDTDGTIFQGYKDAALALQEAVTEASAFATVDLIHCMSNHDWVIGWALSQTVAARLRNNPWVNAPDYNLSEAHRKYYRFENNLFGLTHGDGAKEEKLYGLMVKEARQHISECSHLYWFLHHVHHKDRKARGEFAYLKEKDHNGMTALVSGKPMIEGAHINIEYVRSPSAPDSWHDRNGYVNRQAVECFIHHPTLGQRARFTEWF